MQNFLNSFTSNSKKDEIKNNPEINNIRINPFRSRNKEIAENPKEIEKIKIFGESKLYKFDLKVYGRSLFQNLILTANAYTETNSEIEAIPIKCQWRRIKRETAVYIKDVNSNSYIPTAEDIGYIIEVEALPVDTAIYGNTSVFAQYGPILIDEDMKNTIELLLTSGGTKFSLHLFDIKEQEKINNKEIIIYLKPNELKLVEADYEGKETLLESLKYHQSNPVIKLHPYDSYRISLKFFNYELNDGNFNKLSEIPKSEYHLVALSKQNRELIYLLIHFFLIDEKLKNSKLFSIANYNVLPQETKVGVTDLIAEIKTLREENNVYSNNMRLLEKMNNELKDEMRNLEEDFQITLESINSHSFIGQDMETNFKSQPKIQTPRGDYINNSTNYFELKKKYDEMRDSHSSLLSKEKALREENRELILSVEILKNSFSELNFENKKIKIELNDKDSELNSQKKTLSIVNESKNKLQQLYDSMTQENNKLQKFYEEQTV
jgi:hypothetical protein